MLLSQGTILPNFYIFSIFLQKQLKPQVSVSIYNKGVCGTPLTPLLLFLRSILTIDTELLLRINLDSTTLKQKQYCHALSCEDITHNSGNPS